MDSKCCPVWRNRMSVVARNLSRTVWDRAQVRPVMGCGRACSRPSRISARRADSAACFADCRAAAFVMTTARRGCRSSVNFLRLMVTDWRVTPVICARSAWVKDAAISSAVALFDAV